MKIALVFAALVAVAVAAPAAVKPPVPILQFDSVQDDWGQFALSLLTGDGLRMTRQGELKEVGEKKARVLVQSGSYEYTAPTGELIKLIWFADEDGYHATGDHLPVAPVDPNNPQPAAA